MLRWKQMLDDHPEWRTLAAWPAIDVSVFSTAQRARFLRNWRLVAHILGGATLQQAADRENVSVPRVCRLLQRCLLPSRDGSVPLTRGLIPRLVLPKVARRQPLPTATEPRGQRGAFQTVLETVPGLKMALDTYLRAGLAGRPEAQNLSPGAFHKELLRLLAEAHYPSDRYPYTEARLAYESARQYFHHRSAELQLDAARPRPPALRPLPAVPPLYHLQIDEHHLDLQQALYVAWNHREVGLRLPRLTLLVAVDVATGCNMAYYLSLNAVADQYDGLRLFNQLLIPHPLRPLTTPGLRYDPQDGQPNAVEPSVVRAGYRLIQVDNALAHLAHTLREQICRRMAGCYHLGRPRQPTDRNLIEFAFKQLVAHVHRVPSSTGSHPHDPHRESRTNAKALPRITLSAVEDMVAVLLARQNGLPSPLLGGLTPLQAVLAAWAQDWHRQLAPNEPWQRDPLYVEETVFVRWQRSEGRRPHVNFHRVRYTGDALWHANLVNQPIQVRCFEPDIRILRAYRSTGEYLGELRAPHRWMRFSHSLRTRRVINKMIIEARLATADPLGNYFAHVLAHMYLPHYALELARLFQEHASAGSAASLDDGGVDATMLDDGADHRVPSWRDLIRSARPSP
ncbi:MAG: hypothetical protein HYV16_02100 [Gammaproteobacteria bacterium]|nr:hypothetical protein [Gammaproteobacteria bacterium]